MEVRARRLLSNSKLHAGPIMRARVQRCVIKASLSREFSYPVPGNFFSPADPRRAVALHVIEKARQRHRARWVAADPAVQADAHHLRMLRAILPQQVEGILDVSAEVIAASILLWHGRRVMTSNQPLLSVPLIGVCVASFDLSTRSSKGERIESCVNRRVTTNLYCP